MRTLILFIMIVSSWFAMTILVDFIAVPAVFRNISSREEAGHLGMILFSRFNYFECFFALSLCALSFSLHKFILRKKTLWVLLIILVSLAGTYTFYMSPKIMELTKLMTMIGENVGEGHSEYIMVASRHEFYHQLYIKLDSLKLFVLLGLLLGSLFHFFIKPLSLIKDLS